MPNQRLGRWPGEKPRAGDGRVKRVGRWRRRLGFEPLEDRRLLATITVNTLIDVDNAGDGLTTLREAIGAAASDDTINFSVTGTINLTTAGDDHLTIDKSLTIQGPGASLLTIKAYDPDANGNNDGDGRRVFLVDNGSSGLLNVTISGVTFSNGDPQVIDENTGGGAILNRENLTLQSCVITGNFATNGGAIYNPAGTLGIIDCTIIENEAATDGGGVLAGGGSATFTRTTISNNHSSNSGGGIISRGRPIDIVDSTISGNSANEHGGGLYQYQGSLTVTGSTISGNTADANDDDVGSGGGIYNKAGALSVTNTTISGNSAEDGGGGGIFNDTNQTVTIAQSTITNNVVRGSGNGGGIRSPGGTNLNNTIVAGNFKNTTRDDVSGTFDTLYSLVGDRRSTTVNNLGGSLIGTTAAPVNAMLGFLAANGGRTLTHALLVGSPAIDVGDPAAVAGAGGIPQFDQRGTLLSRVANGDGVAGARIDMGAYEKQAPMSLVVDIAADENDFNYAAGDLSLREALTIANGNPGVTDTISFSAALSGATINLTMGELPVIDSANITGLGANLLTIDASANDSTPLANEGNGSRVFVIDDGFSAFIAVAISGVKLTGGDSSGGGGAIFNRENLTLTAVAIQGNNTTSLGGGIKHESGSLTINDSTLSNNSAATGGAISSDTNLSTETTRITNSTISGNSATTRGGGVYSDEGLIVIRHSTITNNSAPAGQGGGVASFGDNLTRTEVHSSIVAGNINGDVDFVGGAANSFQSNGYNLVKFGNAIGEFVESGDNNNVANPMLGPLADNGGPTRTHLLLTGSPAINAGNPSEVAGSGGVPLLDQRGNPHGRVLNGRIDIGAVEIPPPSGPTLLGDYNLNGVVDSADQVVWRKTVGTLVPQYSGADGNGNGIVDTNDYTVWRSHFGNTSGAAAGESADDEASLSEAAAAAFAALVRSRDTNAGLDVALLRDSQAPALDSVFDALLAVEPTYLPADKSGGDLSTTATVASQHDCVSLDLLNDNVDELLLAWRAV